VAGAIAAIARAGFAGMAFLFVDYGAELGYFAREVMPRLVALGLRDA
jgi:FMNH2-dependent dimethyl sulfone monooxygenase